MPEPPAADATVNVRVDAMSGADVSRSPEANRKPMLIDVHAHAILTSWRAALAARSRDPKALWKDGMRLPEWSAALAIEAMDANGIDAMVLSHCAWSQLAGPTGAATLARAMNLEFAAILSAHPTRFGAFAVLPLFDIDEALAECAFALDQLGFDGVYLPTNAAGIYLGDARLEPLLAELDRRRAVAFVHPEAPFFNDTTGIPFSAAVLEFMFDTTRAVANMICSGMRRRYPNFAYISTHAGGTVPFLAQRMGLLTRIMPTGYNEEVTADDVARLLRTFHFDLTAGTTPTALGGLREITSADRLLMGFDFPFMPSATMPPARQAFDASPLFSAVEREAIYSGNALALFPKLAERIAVASI